ncbi:hypothetical protein EXIGLDRAFT_735711 [Exidia glandulosa HHB12029]|uniref:Uncharacterized protein n=1 Tax=Exidia glandulosa HHB12029 TaxID=1314781 RepID=A0A165PIQ9_EXIGL|nr:hypothetical protein EXIGLDRAFT_735711 [Exidia glandulosa HHB12029]
MTAWPRLFFFGGTPCSLLVISRFLIVALTSRHFFLCVVLAYSRTRRSTDAVLSRVPDLYLPVPTAEALVLLPVAGNAFFCASVRVSPDAAHSSGCLCT